MNGSIQTLTPRRPRRLYYPNNTQQSSESNQRIKARANRQKSHFYSADIRGKFSENSYPNHQSLELKVGAQVMFIKNDSTQ